MKTFYYLNILILFFINLAFSQPSFKKLNLEDCIEIAIENSINYKKLKIEFHKNQSQYEADICFNKPQLSLQINTPYNISKNENEVFYSSLDQFKFVHSTDQNFKPYLSLSLSQYLPTNGNLSLDLSAFNNRWYSTLRDDKNRLISSASIKYEQPLFKKNNYYYTREKADLFLLKSNYNFVKSKNEFVYEVVEKFYDIVLLQIGMDIAAKSSEEKNLNYQLISELFANGRKSEIEFLNSEILLETQKLENLRLRNELKTALEKFRLFLGIGNIDTLILDKNLSLNVFDMDYNNIINIAILKNPTLLITKLDNKNIDLDIKKFTELKRFDLNLSTSLNFDNKQDFLPVKTTDNFYNWRVGLNFNLPVLDGGKSSSEIYRANLIRQEIVLYEKYFKMELFQRIKELYNKLSSFKEEIEIGKRKYTTANKVFTLAKKRFELGNFTLREKLESELVFHSSFIDFNKSIINYNKTVYQLKKLIGLDIANE